MNAQHIPRHRAPVIRSSGSWRWHELSPLTRITVGVAVGGPAAYILVSLLGAFVAMLGGVL